tara:strand:- start:262 stop:438 length:177 start_codon:yes stop_codon:yes gene_type:complete
LSAAGAAAGGAAETAAGFAAALDLSSALFAPDAALAVENELKDMKNDFLFRTPMIWRQ